MGNDFKTLNKVFKPILKEAGFPKLNKNIPDAKITAEQAIRIYLWDKGKFEIPELTEADKNKAINFVYKNPAIQSYAESLLAISKKKIGLSLLNIGTHKVYFPIYLILL